MAGSSLLLDDRVVTVTSTVNIPGAGLGGHAAATFLWNITAISGTWDCAVYFDIGAARIKVAELTGQTTTGIKRLALTADFNVTRNAIPGITSITYTEAVAGTLTSGLYCIFGD